MKGCTIYIYIYHKHNEDDAVIPEEMEVQVEQDTVDMKLENGVGKQWVAHLFLTEYSSDIAVNPPTYYLGDDGEEKYSGIDELFQTREETENQAALFGPRLEISKEKYLSLFKQWRGALIIKRLEKSVSYRTLNQRLRDLWHLELGIDLTYLEEDYYVVRFFMRNDYMKVLEGGPWVILGHYLTVTRWKPKF